MDEIFLNIIHNKKDWNGSTRKLHGANYKNSYFVVGIEAFIEYTDEKKG